ncbi:hypothetical protein BD309DRAFT_953907 [Dichomitus squalens]|nr:hypothetical protein BD309DRAFT_953907 [Dichomitus squalens]
MPPHPCRHLLCISCCPLVKPLRRIHRVDAASYADIFLRLVLTALDASQVCLVSMSPRPPAEASTPPPFLALRVKQGIVQLGCKVARESHLLWPLASAETSLPDRVC